MNKLPVLICLLPALASATSTIFDAVAGNDISQLRAFIKSDPASVTNAVKSGMTPLHYAANLDRQEAAYQLLKAGVPADILHPASRTTPLHWAADANSVDVLRLLLKSDATVDARANNGLTPLHLAARKGSNECIVRLLDANADPNGTDDAGNTPLHAAAARNQTEAVTILLKRHADPSIANAAGQRPADLATDPATRAAFGIVEAPATGPLGETPAAAPAAPAPATAPELIPVVSTPSAAPYESLGQTAAERFAAFAADPATIRMPDSTLYRGILSHGRFEGYGVHVINADGERYEGSFRHGRREGRGRYFYPNGDVLDCTWDDDVPNGAGSFTFSAGGTINGTWKRGTMVSGSGTFSTVSGAQNFGVWQDGSFSSQPVSR